MSESLVRLRHLMGLLTFLDCSSLPSSSIHQFAGKFLRHLFACACPGRINQPAHRQRIPTLPAYINRHLVSRTTDTAGFRFQRRRGLLHPPPKHIKPGALFPVFNKGKSILNDTLGPPKPSTPPSLPSKAG